MNRSNVYKGSVVTSDALLHIANDFRKMIDNIGTTCKYYLWDVHNSVFHIPFDLSLRVFSLGEDTSKKLATAENLNVLISGLEFFEKSAIEKNYEYSVLIDEYGDEYIQNRGYTFVPETEDEEAHLIRRLPPSDKDKVIFNNLEWAISNIVFYNYENQLEMYFNKYLNISLKLSKKSQLRISALV